MLHLLYNLIFTLFLLVFVPYSLLRSLIRESFRQELRERLGFYPPLPRRSPLWFHAASVGEVLCSIPLLRKIRQTFPNTSMILTTMTRTGNEVAKKQIPEIDPVLFMPLDHPLIVARWIDRMNPRLLLIAETEFWPNLLLGCSKRRVPVALFNGRISDRSFRRYRLLRPLFQPCLQSLSLLLVQTKKDQERMIALGSRPERTKVMGNLKFDQPCPILTAEDMASMAASIGLRGRETVLIAGSTHAGEEEILVRCYIELRKVDPRIRLILAPRHLDRLGEIERMLQKQSLPWARKTSPKIEEKRKADIILLDTMGELVRLYSLGTLVFMGGSLVPVGGHNPLEPLLFKRCVLFGPHMSNFREIAESLVKERGAVQVATEEELLSQMRHLLSDEALRLRIGERGYELIEAHRGATERVFRELIPLFEIAECRRVG